MSIVNDLCKTIGHEIDKLPVTELDEVLIDSVPCVNVDLGLFFDQRVDVYFNNDNDYLSQQATDYEYALGSYTCMSSPGVIRLYQNNLTNFFWGMVRFAIDNYNLRNITRVDLKNYLSLVVYKTYFHEIFHFNCNIFREIFEFTYSPLLEEALAVSYANLRLSKLREDGKTSIGRSYAVLYNIFLRHGFEYVSPGYKDWRQFEGYSRLSTGVVEYVKPGNFAFLKGNGVDIEDLVFGLIRTGPDPFYECLI
ncbi:hypothetical protein [Fundidesulfovibrio agrisoli]|uniref:hypothetical protein n=1 Tax=Fundidesulfovibrio agrisoli TaxID=2922717 RepID=UPI001FACAC73|nr:hypothetical protein [Fundidesulfovibrio agrisoli]